MFREGCGLQTAGDLRGRVGGHEPSKRPALPQAVGRVPALTAPRPLPQMQRARSGSPFQTAPGQAYLEVWSLDGSPHTRLLGFAWDPKSQGRVLL